MEVKILRKKDNKTITYTKVNHIIPACSKYGKPFFALYWWKHPHKNMQKDVSKNFDVKRYELIDIIDASYS